MKVMAAPPETAILQVDDLSVCFETSRGSVQAVSGVSFAMAKGEVYALVGESGCGKSTTALAVMRLVPPPGRIRRGHIRLGDEDLLALSDEAMADVRGRRLAMIFQNPLVSLNPVYRAGSQIEEAISLDSVPRPVAWRRAIEVLGRVRIGDPAERALRYPHELSGGMRQRVMTGMMISRTPDLLIADEPTTALDVTIQARILDLLMDLCSHSGMALLIITHDLGIVAEIADRVGVMYAGSLVEQAPVYELYEDPLHPYTRMLMRALPRLGKGQGRLETIPGSVPDLIALPAGCAFHPRCPERLAICASQTPVSRVVGGGRTVACHRGEVDR